MLRWILFCIAIALLGCGPSVIGREQIERSMREFQLAASLREEGRIVGALEHLDRAIELDEENAEAHLLLGFLQMERHSFKVAQGHLKRGIKLLEKQKRLGATLAEARNMHGLCLIELGRHEEAIKVLKRSALDEMNTAPHLAWGNLGLAQLRSGQYDKAMHSLVEATRLQPRFCIGYYRLGDVFYRQERYAEAEEALVRAIQADEECHASVHLQGAWRLRGEVRARLGHYEDALDDLERCVELSPHSEDGRACQKILAGLK